MKIGNPNCQLCKLGQTTNRVCVIPPLARNDIMVMGEAPGAHEEETGKLFSGKSGQLLDRVLASHDIKRRDIIVTNAVSCRPPDNRTPKKGEIKACSYWVRKQVKIVKPKFVLLLGNVPLQSMLQLTGIKKLRGKPLERDGVIYLPTYHPAYILRDPSAADAFDADIRLFAEIIRKGGIPRQEGINLRLVMDDEQFEEMLADLEGTLSYDIETNGLYPWADDAKINTLGFGTAKNHWVLPLEHHESPWLKFPKKRAKMVRRVAEKMRECFVVAHNGKFDALWTKVIYDEDIQIDFDTMIAHYMIDENSFHGLKYLSQIFFGAMDYDITLDEKIGKGPLKKLALYQAHDLFYTRKFRFIFGKMLKREPDVKKVFDKIMMPCVELFIEAEYNGIYIDMQSMKTVEIKLRKDLEAARIKLDKVGDKYRKKDEETINWGSPQQLADLLYTRIGLKVIESTKTGKPSTSESVINRLEHPMTDALLAWRAASKQLSSFIEGWKPFIKENYLHPSFKLHGTVTGRLSCEHPNLQQIPRVPIKPSLITAPDGWVLVEADLSQIELRIAAELSGERTMLQAFNDNIDVHWLTAMREIARGGGQKELVLSTAKKAMQGKELSYSKAIELLLKIGPDAAIELDERWKELRKKAKAINFGYLYGMWWKKFKIYARDNYGVIVTDEQAEASRTAYFELYSDFPEWHKRQKRKARSDGYIATLSGRRRRLPAAMSAHDSPERGAAERQAINSPVQSFANELNLMAAIQLRKEFDRDILRIVGTVHDSILFRIRTSHVKKAVKRILEVMSHPDLMDEFDIKMRVPILAEAKIGSWGKGVSLEKWLKNSK